MVFLISPLNIKASFSNKVWSPNNNIKIHTLLMVQSKSSDPTTSFRKQAVVSSKVQLRGSVLGDGVVMGIAI